MVGVDLSPSTRERETFHCTAIRWITIGTSNPAVSDRMNWS